MDMRRYRIPPMIVNRIMLLRRENCLCPDFAVFSWLFWENKLRKGINKVFFLLLFYIIIVKNLIKVQ